MTQANIHVFENLHEHREFHERVFTSDGAWERKRTDRGTVPFPTAVILDTCSPDRDAVCEWRVDKIAANGGVCMGVSDLNNEQILEDWAGSGKQDRVWYSILRGGWNAIGGVNNGNISVADSLPPFKSGCVLRLKLTGNILHFFYNGKPAGSLPITQLGGTAGKLRFALQTWEARVTLVMASGLVASLPSSIQRGRAADISRVSSATLARSSSAASTSTHVTNRDRFRYQCNFECVCRKQASWAKIGPAPGSPGAPAHPPYACCDACDATYGFMHAKPSLSRTRTGAGRSTSAMARVESDSRSGDTRQEAIRLSVSRLQAGRTRTRTRRPEGGGVHVNKDDVRVGRRATQEGEGRAMVLYCGREYAFNRAALHPTTPQARGEQLESSLHAHWVSLKAAAAPAL